LRATYFISFDGVNYSQFYPTNEPKVKLEQEAGEIFFRWKVDSFKIGATKNAAIYADLLHYFFTPAHYMTDINYQIKENGVTIFEFIAPVLLGKIDSQNYIYECTPDPDDEYRDILFQYESKWYNGLDGTLFGVGNTAYADKDLNTNVFVNVNFTGWSDVAGSVGWSNNTGGIAKARNTISAGALVDIIVKVSAFSGNSMILRGVDGAFNPVGANVTINAIGTYIIDVAGATYLEAYNSSATLKTGSFTYKAYIISTGDDIVRGGNVKDCLDAVLEGASYMNLSIPTVMSTVLWNNPLDSDPPAFIDTYMTANPTNDYVIESAAIWNDLWLTGTGRYTNPTAVTGNVSLKDVMELLRNKIKVHWFIDPDGHFRIEHDKYFRSFDPQLDLTSFASEKPEVDKKIYSYNTALDRQVNYSENNASNEDWIALPVNYTQSISSTARDVNLSNLSTDLDYILDNPTKASNTGLMLLRLIQGTTHKLVSIDVSEKTVTNFYLNAKLGWYYLLKNYHTYFASADVGTVNGAAFTFDHVKEFLEQDDIKFHPTTTIDWRKPFTTSLGIAWLRTAEYYPETGVISINVAYNPYI
jgi:hypothetical protein